MSFDELPEEPPGDLAAELARIQREHPGNHHVFNCLHPWVEFIAAGTGFSALGMQLANRAVRGYMAKILQDGKTRREQIRQDGMTERERIKHGRAES